MNMFKEYWPFFTTILFGEIHSLYLQNKKKQQQKLSELRMYNKNNLAIESGRPRNILRNYRICVFCRSEFEDEYHFTHTTKI